MKLRRFVAQDMRSALTLIKAELGPEAVIMSSKRVDDGVEIVAGLADDPSPKASAQVSDKNEVRGPLTQAASKKDSPLARYIEDGVGEDAVSLSSDTSDGKESLNIPRDQDSMHESFARSLLEILERQKSQGKLPSSGSARDDTDDAAKVSSESASGAKPQDDVTDSQHQDELPLKKAAPPQRIAERQGIKKLLSDMQSQAKKREDIELKHGIKSFDQQRVKKTDKTDEHIASLSDELQSLRKLLQFELAGLISDKGMREQPVRAMLSQLLSASGFDRELAASLSSQISADASVNFAFRELADICISKLKICDDEIITEGGVVTLVGPAGVGKTTTIAKLAARFVIKYGPQALSLVTCDRYRIGAFDQIKTYGRIMGCDAYAVKSLTELKDLLPKLASKSLVLIDTAGVGLGDERFEIQLSELKAQKALQMRHYLVLPATAQRRVLEEAGAHFASLKPRGLILTKTDESGSLCDALSLCLKTDLPLCYLSCGQRVPEDLKPADARAFVREALSSLENETAQSALGDL